MDELSSEGKQKDAASRMFLSKDFVEKEFTFGVCGHFLQLSRFCVVWKNDAHLASFRTSD